MKISILCSSEEHPVNSWLEKWIEGYAGVHEITLFRRKEQLVEGDLLFLISCNEIIDENIRSKFKKSLVIHASDLPDGRGWSPHIWTILNGGKEIVVTMLEAEDGVDRGDIWKKEVVDIPPDALFSEINELLFDAEIRLMNYAVENFLSIKAMPQDSVITPRYYPRRRPQDSELDPDKSITEQFNLLRICDSKRYPAFFKLHGHIYTVTLTKKTADEKNNITR